MFEESIAEYCGVKYALGLGNGSDALTFSLLSLDIGKGDEVITAPNSFVATAWTIANVGARPVFDVSEDYNIDPDLIASSITNKTKAIMPVHLTGRVADMTKINRIKGKKTIYFVIEDAAQAIGEQVIMARWQVLLAKQVVLACTIKKFACSWRWRCCNYK